jgi:hypothetical protein
MNTTARKSTAPRSRTPDAVKLLTADHKEVHALFEKYKKLSSAEAPTEEREQLAHQISDMVTVHATIEEEILYPAARQAGVEVVFSHTFESAVGARHVLHCAAAWGDPLAIHGLGTAGLFAADVAAPVACRAGLAEVSGVSGLGIAP